MGFYDRIKLIKIIRSHSYHSHNIRIMTKNQAKLIKSLADKKNRVETGLFLVEGEKSVVEVLGSDFEIDLVLTTTEFFDKYGAEIRDRAKEYEIVSQSEIEKIGTFATNDSALALVKQPRRSSRGSDLSVGEMRLF